MSLTLHRVRELPVRHPTIPTTVVAGVFLPKSAVGIFPGVIPSFSQGTLPWEARRRAIR